MSSSSPSTLSKTVIRSDTAETLPRPSARQILFHIGLFAATAAMMVWWWAPDLRGGALYAAGLLTILLAHEMGHYFAARHYGVEVSLPYFLPGLPPFYTFGAFIKMKTANMTKEGLLVIGAAGPVAGMVVAIPVYVVGVALSTVVELPTLVQPGTTMVFGDSLISHLIVRSFFGDLGAGRDVMLHPLAYAGWVGFFVTALNLVPIGQLDGGHIGHAMFGDAYQRVARGLFYALVVCGALLHPVWLVLGLFLVATGVDHPPITSDEPLPRWCFTLGYVCFVTFVLTFVPIPIEITPLWEMLRVAFGGAS